MSVLEFWLPFPPSSNRLWTPTRRGMRRTDAYKAWIEAAQWEMISQKVASIRGPFKATITAARPDRRKRDIDNIIAAPFDAIQHAKVIEDDCYCEMVTARWVTSGEGISMRIEKAGVE